MYVCGLFIITTTKNDTPTKLKRHNYAAIKISFILPLERSITEL